MSLTRRITAVAATSVFVLGMPAAAAASDWDQGHHDRGGDNDSLLKLNDNNLGPFQGCNNTVPSNVLGLQGSGESGSGVLGLDNDGNTSSNAENCEQDSMQDNTSNHHRPRGGGDNDTLLKITDNNIGPFQVCNNNVPTNVLGGQLALSEIAGILGADNDGNTSSNVENCEQDSMQDN